MPDRSPYRHDRIDIDIGMEELLRVLVESTLRTEATARAMREHYLSEAAPDASDEEDLNALEQKHYTQLVAERLGGHVDVDVPDV